LSANTYYCVKETDSATTPETAYTPTTEVTFAVIPTPSTYYYVNLTENWVISNGDVLQPPPGELTYPGSNCTLISANQFPNSTTLIGPYELYMCNAHTPIGFLNDGIDCTPYDGQTALFYSLEACTGTGTAFSTNGIYDSCSSSINNLNSSITFKSDYDWCTAV
jgi:hypothetical protein